MTREELEKMTPSELYNACDKLYQKFARMAITDAERSIDWLQSWCLLGVLIMIVNAMTSKSSMIIVIMVAFAGIAGAATFHYTKKYKKLIKRMQADLQGGTNAGHSEDVR